MKLRLLLLFLSGITTLFLGAQSLNITSGTLNIGVINTGESSADGEHWFEITGAGYNPFEIVYVDSPGSLFTISESGLSGTYTTSLFLMANAAGVVNQNVYVKYTPQIPGVVNAQLSIYEFQTFVFHYKSLQGIGKAPELLVEGRFDETADWTEIINYDAADPNKGNHFGEVAYGVQAHVNTFKITNNLPLGGLNGDLLMFEYAAGKTIEISGTHADQFSVMLEPESFVASNYDTTYFKIAFSPDSYGLKTASVSIANNDTDENPFVFEIQGMGIIEPVEMPLIKAASFVDNNSFKANWLSGGGGAPDGYLIDVSTDPAFLDFLPGFEAKDVGSVNSKNVYSLDDATTYYYRVKAYNSGGTSDYSAVEKVKTAPAVPSIMPATVIEQNAFYANWTFVSEATEYRLDVNTSPEFDGVAFLQNAPSPNNFLHVEGLTGGVEYYYRVRSYNGNSSENSAVTSAITLPEKPVAEQATQIIDEGFTAKWYFSNPVFVEGFLLDIATDPAFNTFVPGYENHEVGPFLQAYIIGLDPVSTYYYRVRTRYQNDTTDYSNVIGVTTTAFAPEVTVNIKAFLEGPFNGGAMNTDLNSLGQLPLDQPFAISPWNYNGPEFVGSVPSADLVDWILLRLLKRDDVDTNTFHLLGTEAAWLRNDGQVVNYTGTGNIGFKTVVDGDYYIQVFHRNHLPIISAQPLTENAGVYYYDFSDDSEENEMQLIGQKELMPGIWGMVAADADGNGEINLPDNNQVWYPQKDQSGYLNADYNMDGIVDINDRNALWKINVGKGVTSIAIEVNGDNM